MSCNYLTDLLEQNLWNLLVTQLWSDVLPLVIHCHKIYQLTQAISLQNNRTS
jgi:hypothetical protein